MNKGYKKIDSTHLRLRFWPEKIRCSPFSKRLVEGKLKVASNELATRAQTLPPGIIRRRLIVEKSFTAGEVPEEDRQESRLFCFDS